MDSGGYVYGACYICLLADYLVCNEIEGAIYGNVIGVPFNACFIG